MRNILSDRGNCGALSRSRGRKTGVVSLSASWVVTSPTHSGSCPNSPLASLLNLEQCTDKKATIELTEASPSFQIKSKTQRWVKWFKTFPARSRLLGSSTPKTQPSQATDAAPYP